jgi:hypothetical protein
MMGRVQCLCFPVRIARRQDDKQNDVGGVLPGGPPVAGQTTPDVRSGLTASVRPMSRESSILRRAPDVHPPERWSLLPVRCSVVVNLLGDEPAPQAGIRDPHDSRYRQPVRRKRSPVPVAACPSRSRCCPGSTRSPEALPSGYSVSSWPPLPEMTRAGFEQVIMHFPPGQKAGCATPLRPGPAEALSGLSLATRQRRGCRRCWWSPAGSGRFQPEERAGVRTHGIRTACDPVRWSTDNNAS